MVCGSALITQEMANSVPKEKVTMGAEAFALEEKGDRTVVHYRFGDGNLSSRIGHELCGCVGALDKLSFWVLRHWGAPRGLCV